MGMFDTYDIQWGDRPEGLQTKQLVCACDSWHVGQRAPIQELGESLLGEGDCQPMEPAGPAAFRSLIEDWTLGGLWRNPGLCERHFALGHLRGKFADYASLASDEEARAHARDLSTMWADPVMGPLLAARLDLVIERNSAAWSSLHQARGRLHELFSRWEESGKGRRGKKGSKASAAAFGFYFGPDFKGASTEEIDQAYRDIEPGWRVACLDFEEAIAAPEPTTKAGELAHAASARAVFGLDRRLGAKSIRELAALGEPAADGARASAKDCLDMLRSGRWTAFEAAAPGHARRRPFAAQARAFMARLCASRVGASWALGAMAKIPELMPEEIVAAGRSWGLVDWACEGLGLPTRQILPLIALGAPCSGALAHRCLTSSHGAMLRAVLDARGGPKHVDAFEGESLATQAVRCGSLEALRLIHEGGALAPSQPGDGALADLAFGIEQEQSQRHGARPAPGSMDPDAMDPALGCAMLLLDLGFTASGDAPRSERLAACLALRESAQIGEAVHGGESMARAARL